MPNKPASLLCDKCSKDEGILEVCDKCERLIRAREAAVRLLQYKGSSEYDEAYKRCAHNKTGSFARALYHVDRVASRILNGEVEVPDPLPPKESFFTDLKSEYIPGVYRGCAGSTYQRGEGPVYMRRTND